MSDLSALHNMALFVEVARTGNFSQASRNLGIPGATLSRRIATMEREFGLRLFNRTTRSVALTNAGQRFFERCAHLVDEARLAQESLKEGANQIGGHLRLTMSPDLCLRYISPVLLDFLRQYPDITVNLDLTPRRVDLATEHVDVALRIGDIADDRLIARRIGLLEQALFASPAYLALRGEPRHPGDLVEHDCILLVGNELRTTWRLQHNEETVDVSVAGRCSLNNASMAQLLAERGMGIAPLSPSFAQAAVADGRLMRVLPDWATPRLPLQAVTSNRLQPASVKVFIDFLVQRLVVS